MNLTKLIVFFLLLPFVFLGQETPDKLLSGKITADGVSLEGINAINMVNEVATMTNAQGEFHILAKPGDLLYFGSGNFEPKRHVVTQSDFTHGVSIPMLPKINALDEVVVTRTDKVDDLIMRHKDHKDFTPAERKLYTAHSGPVDILANLISGRSAMLRKELQVEMNERLLARLAIQFEDEYYTQTLKIPQDYIGGFQYYLIEDVTFVNALRAKNKTLMKFLIGRLAMNYKELNKI